MIGENMNIFLESDIEELKLSSHCLYLRGKELRNLALGTLGAAVGSAVVLSVVQAYNGHDRGLLLALFSGLFLALITMGSYATYTVYRQYRSTAARVAVLLARVTESVAQ
jgi:hypothetical protein